MSVDRRTPHYIIKLIHSINNMKYVINTLELYMNKAIIPDNYDLNGVISS